MPEASYHVNPTKMFRFRVFSEDPACGINYKLRPDFGVNGGELMVPTTPALSHCIHQILVYITSDIYHKILFSFGTRANHPAQAVPQPCCVHTRGALVG